MRLFPLAIGVGVLGSAVLQSQGCNAEREALNIFRKQGLNVLRPARDYIVPGGLVIVTKNKRVEYVDPLDKVPDEPGNLIEFRAVILKEVNKRAIGIGVALNLIGSIIPAPLGLSASGNTSVTLGQIESTGRRLRTDARDKFINLSNTRNFALQEIKAGNNIFVVQEIYSAVGLELTATTGQTLDIRFNDGKATVPSCGAPSAPEKPGAAANLTPPKPATNATPAATTGAAVPTNKSSGTTAVTAPSASVGVGVCKRSEFALSLKSDKAIPFAVRLSAIVQGTGNTVRADASREMAGTLGVAKTMGAAVVDDGQVRDIPRRPRR
jgi:hypothetical protein